jgi:methyl-accepting chemotaxis protein
MRAVTRLLLWQKFAILGVLALMLVALPTYQFVTASLVQIDFAETERTGIPGSKSLIELIPLIQTHRVLSAAALSGNDAGKVQLESTEAKIGAAINTADSDIKALADESTQTAWDHLKRDWDVLAKRVATRSVTARDGDAEHRKLVTQVFRLMDLVADHTLITLDPDADTYYLHRMSLYEMAQLGEALAWLREEGAGYLTAGAAARNGSRGGETITAGDRARLHAIAERAKERHDNIMAAAAKVFGATPAIKARLDAPLRSAAETVLKAVQLTETELVEREAVGYSANQYSKLYNDAIDQLYKVDLAAVGELDSALVLRISGLRQHQIEVLGLIAVLTVFCALTGLLVVRSVTLPLGHVVAVMQRVREGDATARSQLKTADEIGGMAQQFDSMMDEREVANARARKENEELNDSVLTLLQSVAQLARKDLTIKVPVAEDVTGAVSDALNLLTSETATVLARVTEVAQEVAGISEQVKVQSDSVMATARSERNEVQEAARELTHAAQTMQDIAKLAQDCNDAAGRAVGTTRTALESVGATVGSIGTIRDTVRETEKRIKRLGERSQEISGVVNLINTISERTHILALNAAMHAASAGEAGRGFAVVAGEVQRLAENAREATSQIATLVHNIQLETSDTVSKMNEVITQVVDGSRLAEQAGQQMRDTEQSTNHLVRMVEEIAIGSKAQASTSQGLKTRAERIEKSTELTSAELQEQTTQTGRLVDYAARLVDAVKVFKLPERKADVVEMTPRRAA